MQFWCCPGVGLLHYIFKPHRGVFVWAPGSSVRHLQLFQNKMTNSRQMPEVVEEEGWARLALTEPLTSTIIKQKYLTFWRKGKLPLSIVVRPTCILFKIVLQYSGNKLRWNSNEYYRRQQQSILVRCLKWRQWREHDGFVLVTAAAIQDEFRGFVTS